MPHRERAALAVADRVKEMKEKETFGLTKMATYAAFGDKVEATKRKLLKFLIDVKDAGKRSPPTAQRRKV